MALVSLGSPELMRRARGGDPEAWDDLLRMYRNFITRVASRWCGRYLRWGRDDEIQVATEAFMEAVSSYSGTSSFEAFCALLIRRRLVDYYRKTEKTRETPMTELAWENTEGATFDPVLEQVSASEYHKALEREERLWEIQSFSQELAKYGLSFSELVRVSPKHRDTREQLVSMARILAADGEMLKFIKDKRQLPVATLVSRLGCNRKTVERHRKYLISLVIVLSGDFPYLKEYIPGEGDGS
ncbi:MAG: RNA polymerase sigma-I factor [Bacillota bacterium]